MLVLPAPASPSEADPVICVPSRPNRPSLHLNFSEAQRTDCSKACLSQFYLLRVIGKIRPHQDSCCLLRRAEGRSPRQKSRLTPGPGIPRQKRDAKSRPSPRRDSGSPRLWCYLASTVPRSLPGRTEAQPEMTWRGRCLRQGSLIRDLNDRLWWQVKGLITPWINTEGSKWGKIQENYIW